MQPTARTIEIDTDHSLHVVQAGAGQPILLIHGAITTSHDWVTGPFEQLSEIGRVTAVDRPGHGQSRRGRFEGSPHEQARQIHAGLQQLGEKGPAVVVGHSFGGLVALAYAELFPEAVSALVLLAPIAFSELRLAEQTLYAPRATPFWGPLWSDAMAKSLDGTMLRLMHRLMFAPGPVSPHWQETYPWDWMTSGAAGVSNGEDAAAIHPMMPEAVIDLRKVTAPTHILHGTNDLVTQAERQSIPLAAGLRHAQLSLLDGGGHMIHHSHAAEVVEAVAAACQAAHTLAEPA